MPERIPDDTKDIPRMGIPKSTSASSGIDRYPDNQKRMWAAYYASVTFMDAQLARVLDELDRLDLWDNTAIVLTSDHGYHLGEHDFWLKSNLHEEILRVPLIMVVPGKKPGRSSSFVELVDIYPTLSDLAGLDVPEGVEGTSLVPILDDHKAVVKAGALSSRAKTGVSWRTPGWHYIRYVNGDEELYDMTKDSKQFHNKAKAPDHGAKLKEMQQFLDEKLKSLQSEEPKMRKKQ